LCYNGEIKDDIGDWWNDATKAVVEAWDDFVLGIGDAWGEVTKVVGDAVNNAVTDIKDWVEDIVPGIVESMFDWLKPIVEPIQFIGKAADFVVKLFTGERPKDPEIVKSEEKIKEHQDAIKEIFDRRRGL